MRHELRTPLNAIIGFSDLLHSDEFDAFAEKRRIPSAGPIHSAGRHLLPLVNDALDLSAVGAAPMTLNAEAFALGALPDELMPMPRRRARDAEGGRVRLAGPAWLQVQPH